MLVPDHLKYSELVVLCGPPRSGTTWLSRQLCSMPKAFPFLPECSVVTQQIAQYRHMRSCEPKRFDAYFGTEENLIDFYRTAVARIIDQVITLNQKSGCSTLVLKDPYLCWYLEDLKDIFPPHRLIVLVRDPRDIMASMKNVTIRKKQRWNVKKEANELLRFYNPIINHQQQPCEDSIFLRYEDIVIGQTSPLHDFLGQGSENFILSESSIACVRDQIDSSDPFFSQLYLQPTTSEKIGSYSKTLYAVEIGYIEDVFSGVMRRWNYPSTMPNVSNISCQIRRILKMLK